MDSCQLIRLRPSEAPALLDLAERIWRTSYAEIITSEQIDYMLGRGYSAAVIEAELATGIEYWKILDHDQWVGFLAHDPLEAGETTFIHKLYVLPERQREGLGSSALTVLAERAGKSGAACLELRVNRSNARAIDAYRKNGFETVAELCTEIGSGYVMDDFVMRRDL